MVGKILYFVLREKKKILGIQIGILAGLEYPPCSLVFQVTLIFCKFGVNIYLEYNTGDNFILMGCVIAGYLFSVEPFLCMPANNAMCISQLKITDMSKIF